MKTKTTRPLLAAAFPVGIDLGDDGGGGRVPIACDGDGGGGGAAVAADPREFSELPVAAAAAVIPRC